MEHGFNEPCTNGWFIVKIILYTGCLGCLATTEPNCKEINHCVPHVATMMMNTEMSQYTDLRLREVAHLYFMKETVAKLPLSRH